MGCGSMGLEKVAWDMIHWHRKIRHLPETGFFIAVCINPLYHICLWHHIYRSYMQTEGYLNN